MNTIEKIQRVTSKGQITLPVLWRRKAGVNTIIVREKGELLEIAPLKTQDERDEEWVTVFSAARDNAGRGIPIEDMLASLKRVAGKSRKKKAHERSR